MENQLSIARELLAQCTPATLAFLNALPLVTPPANAVNEPVFYVSEMPPMPVDATAKYRWMEANFDADTRKAIYDWRVAFETANRTVYPDSAKPEPHLTILFAHCPTAVDAKNALFETMPRHVFPFAYVKALGPAGREDCWVAVADDDAVLAWMQAARDDSKLNCKHAAYVVADNWPAEKDAFPGLPIPHATLVRGLKDINMNAPPPPLGVLAPRNFAGARLDGGTEFVSFTVPGNDGKPVKIKLAKTYA